MQQLKTLFFKLVSLFSVVRGYNVLVIIVAQYLTSVFIMAPEKLSAKAVVLDVNLFLIIFSGALAIASGYIINDFYDASKDLINKPQKTIIDNKISQQFKLSLYFILNFASVIIASYVSFKAVLFFAAYIFFIWLYSHKLKKYFFIGNLTASILSIIPFFAVFVYYKNFETIIFVHAIFLFLLLLIKELTKDLENLRGDFALDYQTIPVKYGIKFSKRLISLLSLATLLPIGVLIFYFEIGYMEWYFLLTALLIGAFLFTLWKTYKTRHYLLLHNVIKFIILAGVLSILLIDIEVVVKRTLN
ncbi:MAG: geranylgeranylglycerol-phosphate geranylgeranyltransferase [Psychroflexus sp.]|jgi:4-hydroxybenzoate polyprenyltransferase|nr:geranylgeranylglycerol-phosphate geranylgeranyltransferase [Psychroflexus sp.]MDR9448855.1 geranylgeranylglycerol-phosphate geranylgeranyltransferase [Psychroflexus sp.]